ncbi:twin-arginine translocation signal domain-containing protein [Halorubellus sp. JP-L1]|uniref:LVIVD repeat-containing protein n=1 Tax=Halorubellus sp. JP-L1 TaxID=2715753 RepID=UPI00140CE781|nr:twin-arginine translocation signal domain-containing protein [Halorubellus sp. JP-L1]NHN41816.1 twin-arginine translocation signal domain-containing protein [Halorubellus sp. JP-L1]
MRLPERREFLKATGALGLAGVAGVGSASPPGNGNGRGTDDSLRLFSEVAVGGTAEVSTQGTYAYVATGDGLGVVDWQNPNRPELVGSMTADAPAGGILDAKVEGDLVSLASNGGPGITLVDVSDPTDPTEIGFVDVGHHIHNNFLADGYAYLTVNESGDAAFSEARTTIVDVNDPSDPEVVGEYRLKDDFPEFATGGVNPCHDVYVQDDLLYQAFWDAGTVVADVSDPTDPQLVTQFGEAPGADADGYTAERYLTAPGNAHYVQPSPGGDLVYVGAETFPGNFVENPDNDDYGGIKIFDVSDYDDPQELARIDPPDVDGFRTSHNFDVTANRLHASWYDGGVTVHDVTDPSNPETISGYHTDDTSFWGAEAARSFTVGADIGGGLVFLHKDRGRAGSPGFDGSGRPDSPGMK